MKARIRQKQKSLLLQTNLPRILCVQLLHLVQSYLLRLAKHINIHIQQLPLLSITSRLRNLLHLILIGSPRPLKVVHHLVRTQEHILHPFVVYIHRSMQQLRCEFPKSHTAILSSVRIYHLNRQLKSISGIYFLHCPILTPFRASYKICLMTSSSSGAINKESSSSIITSSKSSASLKVVAVLVRPPLL